MAVPTRRAVLTALTVAILGAGVAAQQPGIPRLPVHVLDVVPPSAHVLGAPGSMRVQAQPGRAGATASTRRRIVDIAVQDWGFFGFRLAAADDGENEAPGESRQRRSRLPAAEAARVAASIAGYWAVTPQGSWIVARQNDRWNGPDGITARWNAPWSAAFISWVMCEAGLAWASQFERAVAHHAYIDQALRARDERAPQAGFVAFDVGETPIVPGDILCSSRRPVYRTLAERRRQMGVGARSHCDIVVKVDEGRGRVLAIGGNVRGVVSLKIFPTVRDRDRELRAETGNPDRPIFAHLKLRAAPIPGDALESSPAMAAASTRLRLLDALGSY